MLHLLFQDSAIRFCFLMSCRPTTSPPMLVGSLDDLFPSAASRCSRATTTKRRRRQCLDMLGVGIGMAMVMAAWASTKPVGGGVVSYRWGGDETTPETWRYGGPRELLGWVWRLDNVLYLTEKWHAWREGGQKNLKKTDGRSPAVLKLLENSNTVYLFLTGFPIKSENSCAKIKHSINTNFMPLSFICSTSRESSA